MNKTKKVLLYAFDKEGQAILKNFTDAIKITNGVYISGSYLIFKTGVGKERVSKSLKKLFTLYPVSSVFSLGTAGALNKKIKPGDIISAEKILNISDDKITEEFKFSSRSLDDFIYSNNKNGFKIWKGTLVTTDSPAIKKSTKNYLFEKYNANACDMESAIIAEYAIKNGVPFYCFRVISDSSNQNLPALSLILSPDNSKFRIIKNFFKYLFNPLNIKRKISFKKNLSCALTNLSHITKILISAPYK